MASVASPVLEHGKTLALAVAAIFLTWIGRWMYRIYLVRKACHGLPGPPHHWLLGHLGIMPEIVASVPKNVAPQTLLHVIKEKYNLGDFYCFDSFPFGPAMIVACDPDISNQFVVTKSMPKSTVIADFTDPIAGRHNMVADDGERWRIWRRAFNPGFSINHLMDLVPDIADKVSIFKDILEKHAKNNDLFRMEHFATRVTIDIIGKVVLDTNFNSQTGENELVSAFESQVRWIPIGGPTHLEELIDFRRPFVFWWNDRKMKRYLSRALEERFATRQDRGKSKYVIDLALETYMKEKGLSLKGAQTLDAEFKAAAIDQVRVFIFAGHDTSSSVICYCYYHLSKDQKALAAIRKELNEVFGEDLDKVADKIKQDPILLNKLDYTNAVIREVLRMHPPASAIRQGSKDFFIMDPKTNEKYATEHLDLLALNLGLHYSRKRWIDPENFRPERWLTSAAAPEGADRDAWVPFSKGPRNCIGQELAVIEVKTILAMTMRTFDFTAAFDELDKLKNDGSGYPSDSSGVQMVKGIGEEAYQIQLGTAKPREGMPCRLTMVA